MNMSEFPDIKDARTFAQAALNAMSRNGVLPSPRNFGIWLAYAAGTSPELTAQIDQIIEAGSGFTTDVNKDLDDRFGDQDSGVEQARLISNDLLETLRFIQDAFDTTELGQLEFYERLDHYSEKLENANGVADVTRILEEIVVDTVQVREQTGNLKTKLAESTRLVRDLRSRLDSANKDAVTDPLTGIPNRRYFEVELDKAVAQAGTSNKPLSLMFIDIDRFKDFNDKHGHHTGDIVLRLVAGQISACVGERGLACRYGGEEFVVLLEDTDSHTALVMAEKIRIMISRKEVKHRKSRKSFGRITISCGLTLFQPGDDPGSFLGRADSLLYQAKEAGRNRVMRCDPVDEAVEGETVAS